ncbi:helix-turn-helix domain-containing protein [Actinoplanes sp. NPDC026623]|uniref:helix-turn-helix domain-containing protein n=1 Tax=Actinoplanes sp. NPDC026623 TaxID=3155610 RepID=UPI0033E4B150
MTAANGRAYRRMPEDFAAVLRQAGTSTAIADHYGVPRHTAQGWIRRQKQTDGAAGR